MSAQRINKTGVEGEHIGKWGRKHKTSILTDRWWLQWESLLNPFTTSHQHVNALAKGEMKVPHMTVQQRLKEMGFKNVRPEKSRLTATMCKR